MAAENFQFVVDCTLPSPATPLPETPAVILAAPRPIGVNPWRMGTQGPPGIQGPPGDPGANGADGDDCVPGNNTVTVFREKLECAAGRQWIYRRTMTISLVGTNLTVDYGPWQLIRAIGCCDQCLFPSSSSSLACADEALGASFGGQLSIQGVTNPAEFIDECLEFTWDSVLHVYKASFTWGDGWYIFIKCENGGWKWTWDDGSSPYWTFNEQALTYPPIQGEGSQFGHTDPYSDIVDVILTLPCPV